MVTVNQITKGQQWQGNYILEGGEEFFKLLPYLYRPLEGDWKIVLLDVPIKDARKIVDLENVPDYLDIQVFMDPNDLEKLRLERPNVAFHEISLWEQYQSLFKEIDIIFDPKAVKEIYYRAGHNIDQLKQAIKDCIELAGYNPVTMAIVNKVLIESKHTYASDVVRAFLYPKRIRYRWTIYNHLVDEWGQQRAFYSLRWYIRRLLLNKNKYLQNQTVDKMFDRDVHEIDAFTIDHAFCVFTKYNKPNLLPAAMYCLERRTL